MLRRLPLCQDAQVELVLQRTCLGASKVNHLLRASGAELVAEGEALQAFDKGQEEGLRRLVPGLTEDGAEQALRPAGLAGVGLCRTERQAASANLASLTTAWPLVREMAEACETAGLLRAEDLMWELEQARLQAQEQVRAQLEDVHKPCLDAFVRQVAERASTDWQLLRAGSAGAREAAPRAGRQAQGQQQEGSMAAAEWASLSSGHLRSEPNDYGGMPNPRVSSSQHVQRELTLLVESAALARLLARLELEDDRSARRVNELLHPQTCHDWLWKINPRDGSRLAEEDFLLALGSRLGATQVAGTDAKCAKCGEALDSAAAHSTCCAPAESTRGHYAVVSALADGMALADPSLRTEVRGLVSSGERPADILTTGALPGVRTAVDVTVAAPDALHAGTDACAAAYRRK